MCFSDIAKTLRLRYGLLTLGLLFQYGRVERVFINRHHSDPATSVPVFVKFTSQLSALRAVNALEGRVFNGNSIQARFYNAEAFEEGFYE